MREAFHPLTPEDLAPEASSVRDAILLSRAAVVKTIGLVRPDGSLRGPFDPLLRTPEIGDVVQQLGIVVRSASSLSPAVCETVILTVVAEWECSFEWHAHSMLAVRSGLLEATDVSRLAAGQPPSVDAQLKAAWMFTRQQIRRRACDAETMERALAEFGERGVVELTVLVAYYVLVCMLMRTCVRTSANSTTGKESS